MSEKITKFLTPVVALFFAIALGATAATTIGTDIVTEGDLEVTGAATLDGGLTVTGDVTFDVGVNGCVLVNNVNYCGAQGSEPYSCSGAGVGMYFDTDDGEFCFCNGTGWGPIDGDSTAQCATPE